MPLALAPAPGGRCRMKAMEPEREQPTTAEQGDAEEGREGRPFKVGTVAIIGRPNVGKSTLLNLLVRFRLSSVTPKPQTTRHKILGIAHGDGYQIAYLDTPGVPYRTPDELDRLLVSRAVEAIEEADLVVMMVEPRPPLDVELRLIEELRSRNKPAILAINKVDTITKQEVLPLIREYGKLYPFLEIVPISALHNDGVDLLEGLIVEHLPDGEPLFPPDELTDRTERFLVSEMIREQVFNHLAEEVPYSVAVDIDEWREAETEGDKVYIKAVLYVERESQKPILIGRGGQMLKKIGTTARQQIEALLGRPVYLDLWVKVHPRWRRDKAFLRRIGY